jgi:hypothetical protein
MHQVTETHDTPLSWGLWPGLGLGTTDQLVPFHDSTRVADSSRPVPSTPTAVQAAAETHDTPMSWGAWPGLGLRTIDQVVA